MKKGIYKPFVSKPTKMSATKSRAVRNTSKTRSSASISPVSNKRNASNYTPAQGMSNCINRMDMKKPDVKRTRPASRLYQSKSTTTFNAMKDKRSLSRDKNGSLIRSRQSEFNLYLSQPV